MYNMCIILVFVMDLKFIPNILVTKKKNKLKLKRSPRVLLIINNVSVERHRQV